MDVPQPNLHLAAQQGNIDLIKRILAEHGEDVNKLDSNSCTPIHCAMDAGHEEAALVMLKSKHCDLYIKRQYVK